MTTQQVLPALLILALLMTACGPSSTPAPLPEETPEPAGARALPTEPPSGPALAYAIAQPVAGGFAPYRPVPVAVQPAVPAYTPDLGRVTNPDLAARLTPEQQAALEQNGFVVVPQGPQQIYALYKAAQERGDPIFVTTDALLHTFHILYDYTLRTAEIEHFVADLRGLNAAMLAAAQEQYDRAAGDVKEAARRNVAFFAVASALLDEKTTVPDDVRPLVAAELKLIEAHGGFAKSPIFGYREDYSQYVPRGHYTRNETFERYFKAMMWYGRMPFRLRPGDSPEAVAAGRMETRQAILIVAALQNARVNDEPALAAWERIYEPTAFFVGRTDDLSVYDYAALIRKVYGDTLTLDALADDGRLDAFIEQGLTLRPPKIVSSYVTDREKPADVTKGFRFMGQRFIPDSYIIQQLVYDKVGTMDNPRGMPIGLDIPAALGSARAYDILLVVYGQDQYANYREQMEKVRGEFGALPDEQWVENLYWSWLYSLQPLLAEKGEGYPVFMQNQPWVDKDLHTWLGSWAELRHDTILYAKQSYAVRATGLMPTPVPAKGYVEPQPEVYARLAALTRMMLDGLDGRGLLNDEYRDKLTRLETLLLSLKTMSEKELANQPLTDEEYTRIRFIGGTLEELTTFSAEVEDQITSEADERMAIIADVHTDPNTGQVLEVGVGDAFTIYAIVPRAGEQTVTVGGVFSYYEFAQPMSQRLTDEAWQALEPKPERPVWTSSFIR